MALAKVSVKVLGLIYIFADYEKIRSSKSVLIVGGGPSGVELVAEIAVQLQMETKHTRLQEERLHTLIVIGKPMSSQWLSGTVLKDSLGQRWPLFP